MFLPYVCISKIPFSDKKCATTVCPFCAQELEQINVNYIHDITIMEIIYIEVASRAGKISLYSIFRCQSAQKHEADQSRYFSVNIKSLIRLPNDNFLTQLLHVFGAKLRKPWRDIFTYYLSLITYYLLLITY